LNFSFHTFINEPYSTERRNTLTAGKDPLSTDRPTRP